MVFQNQIEFILNKEENQKYVLNLENKDLKEIQYRLPDDLKLKDGENIIEVTVYNSSGVSESTGVVRFVK